MKQIKTIILTMLAALLALPVSARDFEYDGLTYTVIDEGALTCQTKEGGYSIAESQYYSGQVGLTGEVNIPDKAFDGTNYYNVVRIGNYSFARETNITSVVIPETVTTIGVNAFMSCYKLESVVIPESVTSIEPYAFQYSSIREVTLPSSMTEVETGVFHHCGSLNTINLPESITKIGSHAFFECNSTNRSLKLPSRLETIGDFAFAQSGITSVELPESLVSVGIGAFGDGFEQNIQASSSSLIDLYIPASLKSIGEFAFNKSLYQLDVTYYAEKPEPMPLSLFNDETYYRNNKLIMPNANLADIMAVSPWNRFSHIIAKDGTIEPVIEGVNFEYNGMTYTVMDAEAKTCRTQEYWWSNNKENVSEDMFADGLEIPSTVSNGTDNYTVVEIGFQTFGACDKLTSIKLPETLKTIRSQAFISCGNLTSIDLPSSLVNIDQEAFRESGLVSITIPENITFIARSTFSGCKNLASVSLPDRLTAIGQYAFFECGKLESFRFPNSLIAISANAFYPCPISSLRLPDSLEAIGAFNFTCCRDSEIELPDGLKSVGYRSFTTQNLSSLTLPESLKYISTEAFNQNKLKEITYKASKPITALADIFYVEGTESHQYNVYTDARLNMPNATLAAAESALPWGLFDRIYASDGEKDPGLIAGKDFEYDGLVYTVMDPEAKTCKTKSGNLSFGTYTPGNEVIGDVVIPGVAKLGVNEYTVVEIGELGFVEQPLTSVTIPETVKTIEYCAFEYCPNLTSVTLPESVRTMGAAVFGHCETLTNVVLPASLEIMGSELFRSSYGLTSVTYNAETPLESTRSMFEPDVYENAMLYMPNATLETVQSVDPWMDFKKIIAKDGSVGIGLTGTVIGLATPEELEEAGLSSTLTEIAGGTVIVDNEAASFSLAYTDDWAMRSSHGSYSNVKVGDSEEIPLGTGAAGNTNPIFESYQAGAPSAGAVFEIAAKADGWMTVFTKINPNKQYVVFEGQSNPVAYTLGVGGPDYQICYTLPSLESGYIDLNASDASRYFIGDSKPQFPYLVAELESAPKEQTGFITFKVREGSKYYVSALGSKMACQGFVYTPGETEPDVTFCAMDELPEVKFKGGSTPSVTPPEEPSLGDPIVSGSSTIVFATQEDLEMAGIESAKTEIPGGTMILNTDVGSFSLAYDDEWGMASTYNLYRNVKVGDSEEFTLGLGAVGNSNPTFVSYQEGVMSAGAVFKMKAKKDGWMTVFSRMNPDKQYIIFEGESGALPYTLGMAGENYKINYTLPCYTSGENAGMIDFSAADADRYFMEATKQTVNESGEPLWFDENGIVVAGERPEWEILNEETGEVQLYKGSPVMESLPGQYQPQFPWVVAGLESAPGLGTGFMTFRVKAGKNYYVSGLGSKMSCQGFILTESENKPNVTFCATDELPEIEFNTAFSEEPPVIDEVTEFEYEGVWYNVLGKGKSLIGKADGSVSCGNLLSSVDNHQTSPCQIVSDSERGNVFKCEILPDPENSWDCEFFIKSNEPLKEGDQINVSFMYKCTDERSINTQAHGAPGNYQHYECIGTLNATTEWQRFSWSGTVEDRWTGSEGFLSIAFLLSSKPEAATFYVDDVVFEVGRSTCMTREYSISYDSGNHCTGDLVIPAVVYDGDTEYYVVKIGAQSFYINGITFVTIPEGVTEIGKRAFGNCFSLTSVSIPSSLVSTGETPFTNCTGIEEVNYSAETPVALNNDLFPDEVYASATLNTPNATLSAVQATVPWNKFKKVVANDGEIGFGEPIVEGEDFEFDGIYYSVLSASEKVCRIIGCNSIFSNAVVPEIVPYKSNELTVVEIGSGAFAGMSSLESITLPASILKVGEGAFDDCQRLTSLIWNGNNAMPSDLVEAIANPNLLVYVNSSELAPQDHNVVVGEVCENLVLNPGYAFQPRYAFTASRSSMTKEFTQQTPVDGCAGWETIVLPFTVKKVSSAEGHALLPFNKVTDVNKQRPFWLYEADPAGEWTEADSIQAGVPYLIAMPNNPRYNPAYNISGEVTFANSNPQKITAAKPDTVTWTTGRQFRGLWMPLSTDEAEDALGLNVNATVVEDGHEYAPGSAFVAGVNPKPFEAYVNRNGAARAFPIRGAQNAVLTLVSDSYGLTITKEGSVVILRSDADRTVDIHSADGTLLRRVDLRAGEPAYVEDLPQGVCLVAGRKVMIH